MSEVNFEGHQPRRCGEHRTAGWYRAWCHDCSEWCHPEDGCAGCKPHVDDLLEEVARLRAYLDRRQAIADAGRALLRSNGADEDWDALRVALWELDGDGDE